VGRPAPER